MRIYPDLIFSAENKHVSVLAFRVWFLAKGFCKAGATVPIKLFKAYLQELGAKESTYNTWIREARDLGLLKGEGGNKRPVYYRLVSWYDAARVAGVTGGLGCPIEMPAEKLLASSWKAEVWAGRYLQIRNRTTTIAKISRDHNGEAVVTKQVKTAKPVSRRTLQKITGVKRRTQQNREKRAGVRQKQNVLVHEGKRGGFQPYGSIDEQPNTMITSGGVPVEQLPNSRVVPGYIKRSDSRSRTRKVNRALKALCKSGAIAQVKADIPLRYVDTLQQGRAILERDQGVTVLRYAGVVSPGVTGWKAVAYAE